MRAEDRNRAIDGLRGVAALSVFLFHAWLYTRPVPVATGRTTTTDAALHELRIGLVLFFVLSGFLLYRPWAVGRAPGLTRYAIARAARILPAYWLALAGSLVLLWPIGHAAGVRLPPAQALPLFAVFGQNLSEATVMKLDPPMWTLAVEVSFYAVLPLLGAAALRVRGGRVAVPAALLLGGLVWNAWLAGMAHVPLVVAKVLPAMAPYFAVGMLAAVAMQQRGAGGGRPGAASLLAAGAVLVGGDLVWQAAAAADGASDWSTRALRDLPAAVGFAAILVAVAADARSAASRALAWRPLAAVGTVSYGLYLWHVPLLVWERAHGVLPLSAAGAVLVGLPASLAVAAASWRLVERPAMRRARALRPPRPRRAPSRAPRAARARPASASSRSAARSPAA